MSEEKTLTREQMLAALAVPFEAKAIKQRVGAGGKKFSYVSTDTVIRRLNKATNGWDWKIVSTEWKNDLLIVTGELTIHGLGTRTGVGVQQVSERGGEDLAKGGSSDSLKKAATLFGVALDLYGPDLEPQFNASPEAASEDSLDTAFGLPGDRLRTTVKAQTLKKSHWGACPECEAPIFMRTEDEGETFVYQEKSGDLHEHQPLTLADDSQLARV